MKLQGLDPESGIWLPCTKLEELNGKTHVRWDLYKSTAWLSACEIRPPVLKRPLRLQPKRQDWTLIGHPSRVQRGDGVAARRDDGSRGPRLIVYINDPPNGNVLTTCRQTLRYEMLAECPFENAPTPVVLSDSLQEPPRSPSPPPPFQQQNEPNPRTPDAITKEVTGNSTSTAKTSKVPTSAPKKKTTAPQKRKSSSVLVTKKSAKILCSGQAAVGTVATAPVTTVTTAPERDMEPPPEPTPEPQPDILSMEQQLLQLKQAVDTLVSKSEESAKKLRELEAKNTELEARVKELEEQRDKDSLSEILSQSLDIANDTSMVLPPAVPHTPPTPQTPQTHNKENAAITPTHNALPQNIRMSLACYADNPREVGRQLAKIYFTEEERRKCNCNGIRKPPLPPQKLAALRQELFSIVHTPVGQQASVWRSVTKALDAETRSKLSYQKRTVLGGILNTT